MQVALVAALLPPAGAAQKARLPRPRVLDQGVEFKRDAATGELQASSANTSGDAQAPRATGTIRASVDLVEVGCTVIAPDGTRVRGLTQNDFRVFEEGAEQEIASFDAASTPASIALLLDDSPSVYRELGETREAARSLARSLSPEDEVAVAAFAGQTHLLLPFSRNRTLLANALASPTLQIVANSSQSFIYQALYLTAHELFQGRTGRKAIVLLTDGEDSELGLNWNPASMEPHPGAASPLSFDDVARELSSQGISLYVISTEGRPKAMTDAWLSENQRDPLITDEAHRLEMPLDSLYLAEMVRQASGSLYFLREIGGLAEVYRRIALELSAQYTLGYYPAHRSALPGWRELRVELRDASGTAPAGSEVTHRAAYYIEAAH
jgi:Ca-activated chloride channel family protein